MARAFTCPCAASMSANGPSKLKRTRGENEIRGSIARNEHASPSETIFSVFFCLGRAQDGRVQRAEANVKKLVHPLRALFGTAASPSAHPVSIQPSALKRRGSPKTHGRGGRTAATV